MSTERHSGKVKFYVDAHRNSKDTQKSSGYGFITRLSDSQDFFFHVSQIVPTQPCRPVVFSGEYIEFEVGDGVNGPQANKITGIGGGTLMCEYRNRKPTGPPGQTSKMETE
jgi:cold shock CspA family protein